MPTTTTEATPKADAPTLRRVAVESSTDPRTVAAFLAGRDVRPLSRERIERALKKLGMRP
jgi:hypothetical protein